MEITKSEPVSIIENIENKAVENNNTDLLLSTIIDMKKYCEDEIKLLMNYLKSTQNLEKVPLNESTKLKINQIISKNVGTIMSLERIIKEFENAKKKSDTQATEVPKTTQSQ